MKIGTNNSFSSNGFYKLKGKDWLVKQRIAGKIASKALIILENLIKEKTNKSLIELNKIAEDFIITSGGTCTFKNYKGFPAGVCISVNKQLVHGIPTDYKLQEGDIVSFDLGVTIDGAIADTALTCIYGNPKSERHVQLISATEDALMAGIAAIKVGNRLGCIGHAIAQNAKNGSGKEFGIVTQYGGHGLSWNVPHAAPFVANKAEESEGFRIQPGLTIAIEPMFVIGSGRTSTLSDGWTVVTDDIGSHFEHTIYVHEDHVEIITSRE